MQPYRRNKHRYKKIQQLEKSRIFIKASTQLQQWPWMPCLVRSRSRPHSQLLLLRKDGITELIPEQGFGTICSIKAPPTQYLQLALSPHACEWQLAFNHKFSRGHYGNQSFHLRNWVMYFKKSTGYIDFSWLLSKSMVSKRRLKELNLFSTPRESSTFSRIVAT